MVATDENHTDISLLLTKNSCSVNIKDNVSCTLLQIVANDFTSSQ